MSRIAGWTYGVLDSHLGTFAGRESREVVETTFLKPLVSYITKTDTTVKLTGQPAIEIRLSTGAFYSGQLLLPGNNPRADLIRAAVVMLVLCPK